jgi:DNA-binding transcriptional MerR regulator
MTADSTEVFSIGQIAGFLGVAPETVRSWGIRYGLVASGRSGGGHRRYTSGDLELLSQMQHLVAQGRAPADAARRVIAARASGTPIRIEGAVPVATQPTTRRPGGRVLAVPDGSPEARGLARAVSRLDANTATGLLSELLIDRGAEDVWENTLVPVLRSVGKRWEQTGEGVDVEHVLAESTIESFRAYAAFLPRPPVGRPVLLASAPDDTHSLPLHALSVCLRERRVPSLMLGARVPLEVVSAAGRRTGATGIFIWRQLPLPEDLTGALGRIKQACRPATIVAVGGAGWADVEMPEGVLRPQSLGEAARLLSPADARPPKAVQLARSGRSE